MEDEPQVIEEVDDIVADPEDLPDIELILSW